MFELTIRTNLFNIEKMFGFLVALFYTVNGQTDCFEVFQSWYPSSAPCSDSMTCLGDYACAVLSNTHCISHTCKRKDNCPNGTTYLPFYRAVQVLGIVSR